MFFHFFPFGQHHQKKCHIGKAQWWQWTLKVLNIPLASSTSVCLWVSPQCWDGLSQPVVWPLQLQAKSMMYMECVLCKLFHRLSTMPTLNVTEPRKLNIKTIPESNGKTAMEPSLLISKTESVPFSLYSKKSSSDQAELGIPGMVGERNGEEWWEQAGQSLWGHLSQCLYHIHRPRGCPAVLQGHSRQYLLCLWIVRLTPELGQRTKDSLLSAIPTVPPSAPHTHSVLDSPLVSQKVICLLMNHNRISLSRGSKSWASNPNTHDYI